jgi:excisionase family DNA binding protein
MVQSIEELPTAFNELNNRLARIEKALSANESEDRDQVLTVKQAADLLDLRPATIYTKVNKGELPYSRNAGKLRFSRNKLIEWATGKDQ